MFDEKYFSSINAYLPEDAKQILAAEVPKIQAAIAADVDSFGKTLADNVQREFQSALDVHVKGSADALVQLRLTAESLTKVKGAALTKAVDDLKSSITAYEDKWKGLGATLQASVLKAVRATGLPV